MILLSDVSPTRPYSQIGNFRCPRQSLPNKTQDMVSYSGKFVYVRIYRQLWLFFQHLKILCLVVQYNNVNALL